MMKKWIAFLLAVLLLVGVTACGDDASESEGDATTVTAKPTTSASTVGDTTQAGTTASAPAASSVPSASATESSGGTTVTTTVPSSVGTSAPTEARPTGATVPIGTKPVTTTTTARPTTSTTVTPPTGGSTPASTGSTTTTTTAPTTTVPTATPTEPAGPYIVLPAVGSDIDVTKQKNRIRVSGVAAWFNEDGTIGVQLTFRNYSSNWITEETDYVTYTCYDANGNVVQKATKIMIGVIDTKKNVEKTFEFNVPADTAEVTFTNSHITYWTEWA